MLKTPNHHIAASIAKKLKENIRDKPTIEAVFNCLKSKGINFPEQ